MGKCKYCGQKAGFLNSKHKECEEKYKKGKNDIICLIERTIIDLNNLQSLKMNVEKLANDNYIPSTEIDQLYTNGFDNAIEKFLDDGVLTKEEEEKVEEFIKQLNLTQEILDKNGSLQRLNKASIIREITEGNIPEARMKIQGHLPFNFHKDEKLIWLFQNVEFFEQRTKTQYRGGYSGVSIKIAKGVYYRTGGFKGHPVKVEEMKFIGKGIFAITNKHVYFASSSKSIKIPFSKIITIYPYENGIGLQKDGATAKPQIFKNIDGWFTYNVISNLNK